MRFRHPHLGYYRLAQAASWLVSTVVFRRKILRNEIKGKKGAYVIIANHEAQLDFVNLIGLTHRPMTFVISNSFYSTLPVKGILDKLAVIPKQQFQTSPADLRKMKAVIEAGEPLVIYPAGLMCEDGLSTPIPPATYKFLKWLGADVYVARTSGTYFAMPKWAKGMRPGRTYMDVYQLFTKEELATLDLQAVQEKTDAALLFDAYREQEQNPVRYWGNQDISGLEHVLYLCPHCHTEFSMEIVGKSTIRCTSCGYEEVCDDYAFLHNRRGIGPKLRYVSDWSRLIQEDLKQRLHKNREQKLSADTKIHMIDQERHKFVEVGEGTVTLSREKFLIQGQIHGEPVELQVPMGMAPSLPFSPGRYLEIQHGGKIYRCVLKDGRLVMKFINMVKIFHEMHMAVA